MGPVGKSSTKIPTMWVRDERECPPSLPLRRSLPLRSLAVSQLADNDRCVVATEAKAVAHGNLDLAFARLIRRVVQVAIGIGRIQVDGRRDDISQQCD